MDDGHCSRLARRVAMVPFATLELPQSAIRVILLYVREAAVRLELGDTHTVLSR